MVKTQTSIISSGILGGLLAAALALVVTSFFLTFPPIIVFVGCFVSLPIFIVAFGWGTKASFVALVTASFAIILAQNTYIGLLFALLFFSPAVYASWLLGLAKTDNNGQAVKWFPLSSVIFILTGFISIVCVFIALFLNNFALTPVIAERIADFFSNSLQQTNSASEADIAMLHNFIIVNKIQLMTRFFALFGVLLFIGNMYFSTIWAQRWQLFGRPHDDWPTKFRLPLAALGVFVAAFVAIFFPLGTLFNLCALIFYTTFTLVISISGLAYLHNLTRGIAGRSFILGFVYIAFFTLIFAAPLSLILLFMGIWATIQENRQNGKQQ
ncbi:hypothetical protein [uncultured Bartonella sp.]|uniref:hypothetical protein n=1 Tax=uncultured Bartonella sp. TaxID=104108 RepID=UPI0026165BE3|nr:hypothetical protein [uncultured Bartonella sp.]